jgi:flagellin
LRALASGRRIVQAGDDAAGFAIGESLRGQISGLSQSRKNAESAIAMIQTAEGSLNEQNNILIRLRELAVYSASDTVGEKEREFLDREFQQLSAEFDRIARATRYGNKELLTGSGKEFSFHVGPFKGPENVVQFKLDADTTGESAGIKGVEILAQGDAVDALEVIDEALVNIASARSTFGAAQSRFQYTIDSLAASEENMEAARSLIVDADIAHEVSELAKSQILQDMGVAVLSQANQDAGRAVRLIPG